MTNQFTDEQIEAAAKVLFAIEEPDLNDWRWNRENPYTPNDPHGWRKYWLDAARAALVAAAGALPLSSANHLGDADGCEAGTGVAGAGPQAESDSVWELIGSALQTPDDGLTGDEYRRQLIQLLEDRHGPAPVQPSSTVDEGKLAEVIAATIRCVDGSHTMGAGSLGDYIARAVVEAIGGESRGE